MAQTFTNTFAGTGALLASFGTPTALGTNQYRQILNPVDMLKIVLNTTINN